MRTTDYEIFGVRKKRWVYLAAFVSYVFLALEALLAGSTYSLFLVLPLVAFLFYSPRLTYGTVKARLLSRFFSRVEVVSVSYTFFLRIPQEEYDFILSFEDFEGRHRRSLLQVREKGYMSLNHTNCWVSYSDRKGSFSFSEFWKILSDGKDHYKIKGDVTELAEKVPEEIRELILDAL